MRARDELIRRGVFENHNWRPPTFTDMQLHSGYDQPPSIQDQKFDIFSSNGANPFDNKRKESNKLLSPELLRSRKSSQEPQLGESKPKSFADKIFKNMNPGKADIFKKNNRLDSAFSQQKNTRKRTQSKMMDSIFEQNESGPGKLKGSRPQSRGFYFTNQTLSRLAKGGRRLDDSAAIQININDKKKHAFNTEFNVESKPTRNTQPNCL